ncbi:MAG: class IV adenylate cyclase [Patescibacteria group bacterium]|jgi:predicted adenylyl cyclase CyaB
MKSLKQNIELKVKISSIVDFRNILINNKSRFVRRMKQVDTYFTYPSGRLKIRNINNQKGEIIFYKRADKKNSRISDYWVVPISKSEILKFVSVFKELFGIIVVVKKNRELWMYKHTRIHLDKVKDLGFYLELETVVKGISLEKAKLEHRQVIKKLGLKPLESIAKSYSDILLRKNH